MPIQPELTAYLLMFIFFHLIFFSYADLDWHEILFSCYLWISSGTNWTVINLYAGAIVSNDMLLFGPRKF